MSDELKALTDHQLVYEADEAWAKGNSSRVAAIKAERTLRATRVQAESRAQRAIYHAGLAAALITAGTLFITAGSFINNHRVIDLLLLLLPTFFAYLTYRIFQGGLKSLVVLSVLYLCNIGLSIYMEPSAIKTIFIMIVVLCFLLRGIQAITGLSKLAAVESANAQPVAPPDAGLSPDEPVS